MSVNFDIANYPKDTLIELVCAKDTEIKRLEGVITRERILQSEEDKAEIARMNEELKTANGLLTHLRNENKELRVHLVKLADLARPHCCPKDDTQLGNALKSGVIQRAREAIE